MSCWLLCWQVDEKPPFAGIIVWLEYQIASGYMIAQLDNTLHVIEHLLRIVEVFLYVVGIVHGAHINHCRYAALLSLYLTQNIQIASLGLHEHRLSDSDIHHTGNDNIITRTTAMMR